MDISAQSIFHDNDYSRVSGLSDTIAMHATELYTCESLLIMGYVVSCGTNLAKRADWLEKEIARLEELQKRLRRGGLRA